MTLSFSIRTISNPDFYVEHARILKQKRGSGYWLWKPYLIEKCLKEAAKDEVVFYCDSGRIDYYKFTKKPIRLVDRVLSSDKGFLLGPALLHFGGIRIWAKRDCLTIVDADRDDILNKPLLMTWSIWRPTDEAFAFLTKWLEACCDPRCLTDIPNTLGMPNYPGFIDHRHDQAVMSILAHKENAEYLDFSKTTVQRLLNLRPNSLLAHYLYKRPENAELLLEGVGIMFLLSQHRELKKLL